MKREDIDRARVTVAAEGRYDPLLFAENAWTWGYGALADRSLRAWQTVVLDDVSQHLRNPSTRHRVLRYAVATGHGAGKTSLSGMLTTWALACYTDPRIVLTANTESQLVTKTSPEVGQWVRTSIFGDLFNVSAMSIRLNSHPDQHRADFITWSESNPQAFAGLHAKDRLVMLIMDEASEIPDVIYEVAQGAMTDENTVLLLFCFGNPTSATGFFREAFRRNRKYWKTMQIDSRTVEGTNRAALDEIIAQYGEHSDQAKTRVYGQFPSAASQQFIPTAYIDAAYNRHLRRQQFEFAPVILTCDPAWTGEDELVIGLRQGLHFRILDVMERNLNDIAVANRLAHYEEAHRASAVFIDMGYGTGIYSAGLTMGRQWRLVGFAEKSGTPGYLNKRAEMWGLTREWLRLGGSLPPDLRLAEELAAPQTVLRVDGQTQIESKIDLKKRGMSSGNRADALILSFAHPVAEAQPFVAVSGRDGGRSATHGLRPVVWDQPFDPEDYR